MLPGSFPADVAGFEAGSHQRLVGGPGTRQNNGDGENQRGIFFFLSRRLIAIPVIFIHYFDSSLLTTHWGSECLQLDLC